MKLNGLLENESTDKLDGVKRFALHLQQALLDKFDDIDIELNRLSPTASGYVLDMPIKFTKYPRYHPVIDVVSLIAQTPSGCLVGLSRRKGKEDDKDHLYIRAASGGASASIWAAPTDELISLLNDKFLYDIGLLVGEDVNKRVTKNLWHDHDKSDYKPFDWNIPSYLLTSSDVGPAIAKATLDGLHVQCKAISFNKKDPIGSANASNSFNDNVLRKRPKPRQIHMKTEQSDDIMYFIYATHEA
jgi:hypothetical protein